MFKSKGLEALRIDTTGKIKINSLAGSGDRDLYVNSSGTIAFRPNPDWTINGNNVNSGAFIGTINNFDLPFKTNGTEAMRITTSGAVGIGVNPNTITLASGTAPYKLIVGGKLGANEMWCSLGAPWPDYVFDKDYKLKTLEELEQYLKLEKHLPGMASAQELKSNAKINIGDTQIQQQEKIEELYLYLLQFKKELDGLKAENKKIRRQNNLMLNQINELK